uniref:Uncharacterized protein n=1 Tax=viral metagenome TaxID=1070528 RepID=A0A6M3JJE7_9ZZZZ
MANEVGKQVKAGYKVLGEMATITKVKANKTDVGGNFYVYDIYGSNNKLIALNRYVFVENIIEQPFEPLTKSEEDILNPPVEEVEMEVI